MKYFLHDTSALDDEKISELYIEFGYEGTGLFFAILEKMAKQEKPIKTVVLKKQLDVGKKLEKVWLFMEKIGLIHSTNGETFNKQLLNFSESYKIKNEKTKKRVSEWREKQSVVENVTHNEQVHNTSKVKKSKENVNNNNLFPEVETSGVVKKPISIHNQCCEIYDQFILSRTDVGAKINGKEGSALKNIITYLKTQVKNKDDLEIEVPRAFQYIFTHFEKWTPYQKENINLSQIETNLVNILNSIRNGKQQKSAIPTSKYTSSR